MLLPLVTTVHGETGKSVRSGAQDILVTPPTTAKRTQLSPWATLPGHTCSFFPSKRSKVQEVWIFFPQYFSLSFLMSFLFFFFFFLILKTSITFSKVNISAIYKAIILFLVNLPMVFIYKLQNFYPTTRRTSRLSLTLKLKFNIHILYCCL